MTGVSPVSQDRTRLLLVAHARATSESEMPLDSRTSRILSAINRVRLFAIAFTVRFKFR